MTDPQKNTEHSLLLTDDQIAAKLITYDEMRAIYEHQLKSEPYVINVSKGEQSLVFIGAKHTNDPDDAQYPVMTQHWNTFLLKQSNQHKIALVEGGLRRAVAEDAQSAIRNHGGEGGLLTFLATNVGIEVVSPEPDRKKEADYLAATLGQDEVLLYYGLRQLYQWDREGCIGDLKVTLEDLLAYYKQTYEWEFEPTYAFFSSLYEAKMGEPLDPNGIQRAASLVSPTSHTSGINDTARMCSNYRDIHIAQEIQRLWHEGMSLFVVYGSGHSYRLEKFLKEL